MTGSQDPWHPAAIVSAAGLQFALPVARCDRLPDTHRPLFAVHPQGEPMPWGGVPAGAILAFGTERHGASRELLNRSTRRLSIPMTPGVSSLNLATSVAVALYASNSARLGFPDWVGWRPARPAPDCPSAIAQREFMLV